MGEDTGIRVPLFGLSELPEEGLDGAWAEKFSLGCFRDVIDVTVTVLK